jgi:hypothetical protein
MHNRIIAPYRRTPVVLSLTLALAFGVAAGWQMRTLAAVADESAIATAEAQLGRFYGALEGKAELNDVLGEAFQLIRTDGRRYDRAAYLANASTVNGYRLNDVQAYEAGGVLTATFNLTVTGKIGGVERQTLGLPRMVVFSKVDGAWKLQAYANLGQGLPSGIDDAAKAAVKT